MSAFPPDRSRDRRIEDPTNLWLIYPAARALMPVCIRHGITANMVSVFGLGIGGLAALAYSRWEIWPFTCLGLLLTIAWLIADGLDGMIARATGTASPLGRALDGMCDHGVFAAIYLVLASSLGTTEGWVLAISAGAAHAFQANQYESERGRFHRRCQGLAAAKQLTSKNPLVRIYDRSGGLVNSFALRFDEGLMRDSDPLRLGTAYGDLAARPMRLMSLLSANVRIWAIFLACLAANPSLFWWFELFPLTGILIIGLVWHRRVETRVLAGRL